MRSSGSTSFARGDDAWFMTPGYTTMINRDPERNFEELWETLLQQVSIRSNSNRGDCNAHGLCRASLIGRRQQVRVLEDHGQRHKRCVLFDQCAAHHRCTEADGAAVLDVSSLHFQHHVLEGMKLQESVDMTILAKAHRVPIGALHWLVHDCPPADPASHPP